MEPLPTKRQKSALSMDHVVKSRLFWSGTQFQAWQDAIGLSGQKAATALGVSDNSITNFRRRGCSKTVALAAIALYGRQDEALKPWETAS